MSGGLEESVARNVAGRREMVVVMPTARELAELLGIAVVELCKDGDTCSLTAWDATRFCEDRPAHRRPHHWAVQGSDHGNERTFIDGGICRYEVVKE